MIVIFAISNFLNKNVEHFSSMPHDLVYYITVMSADNNFTFNRLLKLLERQRNLVKIFMIPPSPAIAVLPISVELLQPSTKRTFFAPNSYLHEVRIWPSTN